MAGRDANEAALAEAAGVATSYLDQLDKPVEIARETQLALLEALGFPANTSGELQDSLTRMRELRDGAPLWRVVEAGRRCKVDLPKPIAADVRAWRIVGEEGARLAEGKGAPVEAPALPEGYHRLEFEYGRRSARTLLIAAPATCWRAPAFEDPQARGWGLTAQVYGLRSARDLGIGDFTDVGDLARAAGSHGASFLGLSPLHALFASDRSKISPYSPSSRLFLEPLYLDVGRLGAEIEEDQRIARLRAAPLVNYRAAWEVKSAALEAAFERAGADRAAEKRAALGDALELHATFEALSEHFLKDGRTWPGMWPQEYLDSRSPEVARFQREHRARVDFHAWLQVCCDEQLAEAAARTGMELGLYRDLAVGADRHGSEVWAQPDRYALSLSVGAPPDPLGPQGQNWGFPPFHPITLEQQEFAAFRDLVRANMRHAGAIRIDHAFQLERLFVVPSGWSAAQGGYVAFPFEALLAILRLESRRNRCMVIAEDLGTGPKGFSDAIMRSGILSYRILSFERTKDGGFVVPGAYPRDALAAVTTHDLPTFKGWRRGFDIDLRSHFGVYSEEQARGEQQGRLRDVDHWRAALKREGLSARLEPDAVSRNEALAYLARTPSVLLAVQIEDALDEINQANLPGLSEGPPNWRRRMSEPLEEFTAAGGPLGKLGALMAEERRTPRARESRLAAPPPRATYRLQFHKDFTFDMARKILPYVRDLGISHVYASPIQKAAKGSTHGYDVVDPREINPELGGRAAFDRFAEEVHALGLKLIVDIVPNHMGVGPENPFWRSVLQWGEASPYAHVFDIDFRRGGGRVLLPVLGKSYAQALDDGELALGFDEGAGAFVIRYFDRAFPVAPQAQAELLESLAHGAPRQAAELRDIASRIAGPDAYKEASARLAALARDAGLRRGVDALCADLSKNHERLDALMARQAFRLAHWRLAGSEINYRRFFEINSLAGVRVEDESVFEITHGLVLELVAAGQIDGLRIDHIDGLAEPELYLERLQERVGPGFYIVAEKILERGERLKPWPIAGTTGYDALNEIDGILFDHDARQTFEAFYRDVAGVRDAYEEALARAKRLVLEQSFGAETETITEGLYRLAQARRETHDIGRASLRRVLKAAIVALPVYRTYVGPEGADANDAALLSRTMARVREEGSPADEAACDFLLAVLSGASRGPEAARLRVSVEQLTGPVMAKGLEDTLFYRYAPFLALNEVGADPSHFGFTREEFHASQAERARHWPAALIATATHDTKRGEDARARLLALSGDAAGFTDAARGFLKQADGIDRADAYLLFQALVGAWPLDGELAGFRDRAAAFLTKALREAKRRSSWTDPDEAYEKAALACLDKALAPGPARDLIAGEAKRAAFAGALNGLARTVLKATLPGVPDFYQGAGLWDFSFVDPDNRRPVDFTARAKMLAASRNAPPGKLLAAWRDGAIKQWLVERLLAERAAHPDFFAFADYAPLAFDAGIAFARGRGDERLVVYAMTGTEALKRKLVQGDAAPDLAGLWGDARLELEPGPWRNLLTGSAFAGEGAATCADAAGGLPWLILGKWHE